MNKKSITYKQDKGYVYFFRYKVHSDDDWQIGISGLQPYNLKEVSDNDDLVRLTNKKLKSTIHRVVNPPRQLMNTPRYSIPFFMHPRSEMSLAALPGCVDGNHPKRWDDISAGEFLDQRLKEIGLKK